LKSLLDLLENVILEMGDECSVNTSMDIKTIRARVEHEGLSFLTITLPAYGNDFERSLALGHVDPGLFLSFKRRAGLPLLFGGFLDRVFDRVTGIILEVPSIPSIRALRQMTKLLGKVELECTPARIERAYDKYVECEQELINTDRNIDEQMLVDFHRVSRLLFRDIFTAVDNSIADLDVFPKHGPGATAEKVQANAKYFFRTWTSRLEDVFPYWRYATSRPRSEIRYDEVQFFEPGAEPPCRLVSVPKTLKTPRIIAIEPTHMQFMQQSILRALSKNLEKDSILRQMISMLDQTPNQRLAMQGSLTGQLATLDLSEASDRVLNRLVVRMLSDHPHLADGVAASRSTTVDVPGHGIIPLTKFASMGSALCFPMEIFVFTTLLFMGIERANGTRFTRHAQFNEFVGQVRVFGDDIIVPVHTTGDVIFYLELFGAKVNSTKSFWTGKFRESCGSEYFDGEDVTIVKLRQDLPRSRHDVHEMVSLVDFRNQAYWRGLWKMVRVLDRHLESIIPLPAVSVSSTVLGKHSVVGSMNERWCNRLHRPMVQGMVITPVKRRSPLDGDGALMKFFLSLDEDYEKIGYRGYDSYSAVARRAVPIEKGEHLVYAGRPVSFNMKYRWAYSSE